MSAYLYILEDDTGRYYIGSTIDLNQRLHHHASGGTPSTRRMKNVKLVFSQKLKTLNQARLVERKLKRMKRKDYIKKIVDDGFLKIAS